MILSLQVPRGFNPWLFGVSSNQAWTFQFAVPLLFPTFIFIILALVVLLLLFLCCCPPYNVQEFF